MLPREIRSLQEFNQVISTPEKLIIVEFVSKTCTSCIMMKLVLEKFSLEYQDKLEIYTIDIDTTPIAEHDATTMTPTFLFYKNGAEIIELIGADPAGVKKIIASNT